MSTCDSFSKITNFNWEFFIVPKPNFFKLGEQFTFTSSKDGNSMVFGRKTPEVR